MDKSKEGSAYFFLILLTAGVIFTFFIVRYLWQNQQFVNEPLHSSVEMAGALIAMLISVILFYIKENHEEIGKLFLLALGLLSIGLVDGFHAVSSPGNGFVFFHSMASFAGGFWFVLVWSPFAEQIGKKRTWQKYLPLTVSVAAIFFGLWTLNFRQMMPTMVRDGEFTFAAMAVNVSAGLMFFAATARLMMDFHRSLKKEFYIFSCIAMLFGMSNLMFSFSRVWDVTWWLWHILRLSAYLIALIYLLIIFFEMFDKIQQLNADLEKKIEKRTQDIKQTLDIQNILNSILKFSLEERTPEGIFQYALNEAMKASWLAIESKYALFIIEDEAPDVLVMKAQKGISEPIRRACSKVRFGQCLCGRAAASGKVLFSGRLDETHEIRYENILNHGHYCVPIVSAGKVLGVLTTYLKEGHQRNENEENFLMAISNVIANVIERNKARDEEEKMRKRMLQSDKMSAVGQLAAGITHEINNPIGIILGFVQGMIRRMKQDEPFLQPLRSVEREAIRCQNIIKDLLTFSRADQDDFIAMDLNETIENAFILISTRAKINGVEIIKKLSPNLPPIRGNSNQIQQVAINLSNNAIDAMPNGGTLGITTEFCGTDSQSCVCMKISDTGNGIPPEIQSKIYEPFFTTKEAGKGTGLGLSLVYDIVKKHSGSIEVESFPGFTEFCVKFSAKTAI